MQNVIVNSLCTIIFIFLSLQKIKKMKSLSQGHLTGLNNLIISKPLYLRLFVVTWKE